MLSVKGQQCRKANTPQKSVKVVERIISRRIRNTAEYYVRWKNFDESYNSWEQLENLNCWNMIQIFEENWANEIKIKSNKNLSLRKRNTVPTEAESNKRLNRNKTFLGDTKKKEQKRLDKSKTPNRNTSKKDFIRYVKDDKREVQISINSTIDVKNQIDVPQKHYEQHIEIGLDHHHTTCSGEIKLVGDVKENLKLASKCTEKANIFTTDNCKSFYLDGNTFVTDFLTRPCAQTGFEKGMAAEEILGATRYQGCIYFVIKFKGDDEPQLIVSDVANVKIPNMVIRFYEGNLSWITDDE